MGIQYVNDIHGNVQSVQLPLRDWEKLMHKVKKYEQALKLKSDLQEAFKQVTVLRKQKPSRQTLKDFLDEL